MRKGMGKIWRAADFSSGSKGVLLAEQFRPKKVHRGEGTRSVGGYDGGTTMSGEKKACPREKRLARVLREKTPARPTTASTGTFVEERAAPGGGRPSEKGKGGPRGGRSPR